MPLPIAPIGPGNGHPQENNMFVDYSFLAQKVIQTEKKKVTASNKDADLLMKIWLEAESKGGKFTVSSDLGLNSRDIMRLKTYGLIAGDSNELEITARGKKVITVMALGEGNKFEKGRKEKNYLEIMASMDKKGKDGYRIPKFCSNTSNNLNVNNAPKK
jgi:hypothetical protein